MVFPGVFQLGLNQARSRHGSERYTDIAETVYRLSRVDRWGKLSLLVHIPNKCAYTEQYFEGPDIFRDMPP
jgi:hypothetical protein